MKRIVCVIALVACIMQIATPAFSQSSQMSVKIGFRIGVSDGRLGDIEKECKITITEIFWVSRPGGPLYRALLNGEQTFQGANDCLLLLPEVESVSRY